MKKKIYPNKKQKSARKIFQVKKNYKKKSKSYKILIKKLDLLIKISKKKNS